MIRRELERIVAADRFRMPVLCEAVLHLLEERPAIAAAIPRLRETLGPDYREVVCGVIRHAFLIELVKVPKIETTKVRVRWYQQLDGDQRYCPFKECLQIVEDLVSELADGWLEEEGHRELLELFLRHRVLSYELPLDYDTRPPSEDINTRIHRRGNLCWTGTDTMRRTLLLRRFLTNPETSPDAEFFTSALTDKIKVKTYLTDRVLTGDFKTNREKRWEVHPRSVHFADRRTCLAIEYTLIV